MLPGFNCNGGCVASLSECSPSVLEALVKSIGLTESIRYEQGSFLFWEQHYFRMMAALRRMRFPIPISYTPENLLSEVEKLLSFCALSSTQKSFLFYFHFVLQDNQSTSFIIRFEEVNPFNKNGTYNSYEVDLYREAFLTSGFLANQSIINEPIRKMAKAFAQENDFKDLLLLNDQKELVETLTGSLFWLEDQQIYTPPQESGTQNLVFRKVFINFLEQQTNISIVEKSSSPFALQAAQEVFVISLERGFDSISKYRKTSYKQEISKNLFTGFLASPFIS